MNNNVAKEQLGLLLEGKIPGPADLDALIEATPAEDQYVDFKEWSDDEKKLKRVIRKWTTGFANADGGILVLGVSSRGKGPRRVKGRPDPAILGGKAVEEWANTVLLPLAGRFSPSPVCRPVIYPRKTALLVATGPAPELIPYEGNQYAIRMNDSTVDVTPTLLADLVLGRRRHPVLEIIDLDLSSGLHGVHALANFGLNRLLVENRSLVHSVDTEVGVVAWSLATAGPDPRVELQHVLQYVDAVTPTDGFPNPSGFRWLVAHTSAHPAAGAPPTVSPFRFAGYDCQVAGWLPTLTPVGRTQLAVYLLPKGSPPKWYQVSFRYALRARGIVPIEFSGVKYSPVMSGRPRLHWSAS